MTKNTTFVLIACAALWTLLLMAGASCGASTPQQRQDAAAAETAPR